MLQTGRCISRSFLSSKYECYARNICNPYNKFVHYDSAGIIVIGDEILKAQVKDTNSHYMCNLLYKCGVRVKKITIVSDEVEQIAAEISDFSRKYMYVITSGGIGPTHDDVTYEALAKAFDDSLHYHPTLVDIIKDKFNIQDLSSPGFKMAYIPKSAMLKFSVNEQTGQRLTYPCVIMENVHVFPGSPVFLENSFRSLHKELFATHNKFVTKELYVDAKEESFANALTVVSKEFPHVSFGSYPEISHSYYKARVTIESNNKSDTERAETRFCNLAPPNTVINYDQFPLKDPVRKYENFIQNCQHGSIYENTFKVLRNLYRDPAKVVICFDGSIESMVLLHLAYVAGSQVHSKSKLQTVYFKCDKPFVDVENFIRQTVERYNVDSLTLKCTPQRVIKELLAVRPQLKVVLLGVKADKVDIGLFHGLAKAKVYGQVEIRCPLIEWTYKNVWTFARSLCLPYCPLYDQGFTSIGSQDDTGPNPNLLADKSVGSTSYHPAHTLHDPILERAGRIAKHIPFVNFQPQQNF